MSSRESDKNVDCPECGGRGLLWQCIACSAHNYAECIGGVLDADAAMARELTMLREELRRANQALFDGLLDKKLHSVNYELNMENDSLRQVNTMLRDGWETLRTNAKRYEYLRSGAMPCGVMLPDDTWVAKTGEALDFAVDALILRDQEPPDTASPPPPAAER